MSFLFVDRITALDSDSASGWLDLGAETALVPPWLVIEAVGQLAAWIAIVRSDFVSRPVAAIVGEVRLSSVPARGRLLLAAHIERFDGRAILYSGTARGGDAVIAELARCVGPMLPMDGFDHPDAMRQQYTALRAAPARELIAHALPRPVLADAHPAGPDAWRGALHVPRDAPLFADHFPRRPVYPATLLADALNQLALLLAASALGVAVERIRPQRVADFKVRAFSPPGQSVELGAEVRERSDDQVKIAVSGAAEGKRIVTGRIEYGMWP